VNYNPYMLKLRRLPLFFLLTLAALAQTAKRPLNHRDYDSWRTIQNPTLSPDGKFLAYALVPEEGDGELVVRDLTTGREFRENCGRAPAGTASGGEEAEAPSAPRAIRIAFTHDGTYLVAGSFPTRSEQEQAKKDRKRPEEMPRNGMILVNLAALTATRVADVATFQVPETGDNFIAYLRGPKPGANGPAENYDEDQEQNRRRSGNGGRAPRSMYGSDLVLRDLRSARERTFEDVLEYSMAKDGKTLLYAVQSKKEDADGVYAFSPGSDASPLPLLSGKGRYTRLTWDFAQRRAAFLSDRDDQGSKPARFKAYLWPRSGAPAEVVSTETAGFRAGWMILDRGPINFSRDGLRLFVSCAPLAEIAALEKEPSPPSDDIAHVDLWTWKDDYIQPMQKVRAAQDRSRSYRAVYLIAERRFLQLSDPSMAGLTPSDEGRYALGTDDRTYRRLSDYEGNFNDVFLVDEETGARKLALKQFRGGGGRAGSGVQISPDGRHALAFKDKQWWSISVPDAAITDLTAKLGPAFYNEDHDTPDDAPAYGSAGWTRDGKWAILYDRYDVWAVSADGLSAKKLTDGRAGKLQFRVVRLPSDEDAERGVDTAKPLFLRAENLETRDSGFFTAGFTGGAVRKLVFGAKNYRLLGRAKDADVEMFTATTFHDQPDIYVADSSFRTTKKVTDANPQQSRMLWGTGELMHYRNADGLVLEAALYKPENFDPSKKYPMIVYLYERLSQNVNNFVAPSPGHSINFSYYVSNGYLVLTPDIVYTTGHPGQSALKCVLPAVEAVVDKGFVNRNAIGIQGHSWGGYQTAYLVTQTNLFRAAEAGAPVADMISAYDGIRWGSGLPRQFQYEKTQSRIGGSIWQSPLEYLENSPIFMVDRITTPLLILHNDGDDAVPWYQGIELFLAMRRLGKEAYLFDYNGEPHHLLKRANQKDYTVRMQEFFDHFLKDARTPEWMEKGIPYIDRNQEKAKITAIYGEAAEAGKKEAKNTKE